MFGGAKVPLVVRGNKRQVKDFARTLAGEKRYYKDYVKLMNHWDDELKGKILRDQNEDVVNDLDNQVKRILDYCELSFEENCINFHKTERNVRTPSSEQVRQPIYKSGLEQWKNFESWLQPLKDALGENYSD